MPFTGREVIAGGDPPKANDFAVASAVQLAQKNRERRGGEKNKTKNYDPGALQDKNCVWEQGLAKLRKEKIKLRAGSGVRGWGKWSQNHWITEC